MGIVKLPGTPFEETGVQDPIARRSISSILKYLEQLRQLILRPSNEVFLSLEGEEIADPAAPATNRGILYFRDNGAGKTQLVARFPTGAVQVIVTEP